MALYGPTHGNTRTVIRVKLYYTPIKDYVHTVEAVINFAELRDRVELVPTKPFAVDTPIATVNPLGKVPTLVLDDGEYLAGGLVIYEYLDSLHRRRKLYPAKGTARWMALRQAWMADGLFDTVVLIIIESWLPQAEQRPAYVQRCWGKVLAMLDQMERDVLRFGRLDIGQMRTVGALQFLRLKMPVIGTAAVGLDPRFDFMNGRPHLSTWFKSMNRKKIFRTPLQPPT
jgi:glutathione S-transferase